MDPGFPARPYVYVLYTYDAPIGGFPPTWGDGCANPPGATADGCVVSGRLSRLTAAVNQATGPEQVLVNDWCQQYPSHSVGDLAFGADGALYVTAGDGASFTGSGDPNARRIVAQGLRNPFRMAIRPGTSEVWLGDVGWNTWEELNRIPDPTARVTNFGWPCYEGTGRQPGYDGADLNLCESLYGAGAGAVSNPYYAYNHGAKVVAGESCPSGGSSTAGVAFYPAAGGPYPADYRGALFFADYTRDCIWVMRAGTDGLA